MIVRQPPVAVETRGEMPSGPAEYARSTVLAVAGHAHEPLLSAQVRLTQVRDPAVRRSAVVRVGLDVDGRIARARVAAETMREAIDPVKERLDHRLARLEHWRLWPGPTSLDPYERRPSRNRR